LGDLPAGTGVSDLLRFQKRELLPPACFAAPQHGKWDWRSSRRAS